jgi:hypothetical protein
MVHRGIVWVDFTLRREGNRLFFRVKSTSRTTGNLSRCTDGGNRRIFGGMTPVSDGELPRCSVRANLMLPRKTDTGWTRTQPDARYPRRRYAKGSVGPDAESHRGLLPDAVGHRSHASENPATSSSLQESHETRTTKSGAGLSDQFLPVHLRKSSQIYPHDSAKSHIDVPGGGVPS